MAYETDDGVVCEQCGNEYSRIGMHWTKSSECEYPELSQLKKDVIIGSLMGDGCIHKKKAKNQTLTVMWSSKEQCQWLDDIFGWSSTGVSLHETGESQLKRHEDSDFTSDDPDFSDIYVVNTRTHPFITSLTNKWYGDSGNEKKCWPEDIELTPTVLLLWYIGDGHYAQTTNEKYSERYIYIALSNERGNEEKVNRYFTRENIPQPTSWRGKAYRATWTVKESKTLLDYMAQSPLMDDGVPDGFEYKFPEEYGGTGKSMADVDPWQPKEVA